MKAEIPKTIKATKLGFGIKILELLAQCKFVSADLIISINLYFKNYSIHTIH